MTSGPGRRRLAAAVGIVLGLGLTGAALSTPAVAANATSRIEKRRVDGVKTPTLKWFECAGPGIECATAKVPRDYDHPDGRRSNWHWSG